LGQVKKTQKQIQNELDEIHTLLSQGASDEYIIKQRELSRPNFYRYKKRLYKQVAKMYEDKRIEDYYFDIQLCKERLTQHLINATTKAHQTDNPLWGQLAAELAVSLLKLEAEGITAVTRNGNLRSLEQKTGYLQYNGPATAVPQQPATTTTTTNDERQF
jgi:hypothetical protein